MKEIRNNTIELEQREINLIIALTGVALRSNSKDARDSVIERKEAIIKLQQELKQL